MFVATTEQMQELDHIAIGERGIPSLELMERAAHAVARAAARLAEESAEDKDTGRARRVGVLCGPGNNGGDGVAAARLLREMGLEARAFLVGDRAKMTPDSRAMEARLSAAGGRLEPFDLENREAMAWLAACGCLVDALFGVGLSRPLTGDCLAAVGWMNASRLPVVACDLPSGVEGDTGKVLGAAVRARVTVTFTCPKPGLCLGEGAACAGEVRVADIGIPEALTAEVLGGSEPVELLPSSGRLVLPRRPGAAHKGDFGRIFILGGSEGYTGAPLLAARGALRAGAGLVSVGVPREVYPIAAVKCDEAMAFPLPERYEEILARAEGCDVVVIGPGLGRAPRTERLVRSLLSDLDVPVVLDADGIKALSGHIDILDRRTAPTVLTPHEGEFARLTGCALPVRDRVGAARDFARAHRCTLVLKGRGTVTAAADGRVWINGTGGPGMAKGGSGDVLAGMIAALWGQKHLNTPGSDRAELAAWAVWYHGAAGDRAAAELGEYAMLPTDLLAALPGVLKENTDRD